MLKIASFASDLSVSSKFGWRKGSTRTPRKDPKPGLLRDSKGCLAGRSAADLAYILRSIGLGTTTAYVCVAVVIAAQRVDLDSGTRHPSSTIEIISDVLIAAWHVKMRGQA